MLASGRKCCRSNIILQQRPGVQTFQSSRLFLSRRPASSSSSLLQSTTTTTTRPQQSLLRRWKSTSTAPKAADTVAAVEEPSFTTLRAVALAQAIPFIGFGFMDNAILIIAGDAIDTNVGVVLGISTLCAAAIGNIISDLAGIVMGTAIEDFCAQVLKLPLPNISSAQRQLRSVRFAGQFGMAVGLTIGCIIGMFPLFFIDSNKIQQMKKTAHLESLFKDVVTEAKTLVGAESTCLYLRVEEHNKSDSSYHHLPYKPTVDGEYLYAMYYDVPGVLSSKGGDDEYSSRLLPLGKGIISRAVLTGDAWNVHDVHSEPDFFPDGNAYLDRMKNLVVVPVLDEQGHVIAAIRAMNKKNTREGKFTDQDVQILKSLASHISVSLSTVYHDEAADEVRLRDTIRNLKKHGIQGKAADGASGKSKSQSLFPVD